MQGVRRRKNRMRGEDEEERGKKERSGDDAWEGKCRKRRKERSGGSA